ncbi:hypothetical protein ACFU8R_04480 [Pseudonocardia alni]|jgi:hypothetical protein|uniref:Uncharacterized protein n=2 Tax=Pseudonocardia TaxID=1847 RepID=A0A852W305_PSEA5|nr:MULTISPECIES: hypothetical protein [Pseudonocardia]OJG08644.1 hypothetical protein BG618_00056 [Pseudonocardia autotrophica]MBO4237773.1 hypothetical protein [Pseudonocardia alni]MYW72420.1 hypothetical protein [Pseudonocardia sp. SID8383]NYG02790.1 hypothetical protein [Pseudonocardia antarctica]PKB31669.1 hypothetical protein ATL51_3365 [Pseudonocardia alni]
MTASDDAWSWPDATTAAHDLAAHLEDAARALRDGRAEVRRSATGTASDGHRQLEVDLTWREDAS